MTAEYPVETIARVRVGEWEGLAARDFQRGLHGNPREATPIWLLIGHPSMRIPMDSEVTVLAVELPAPVAEPKAFGARVEFDGADGRDEAVLVDPGSALPWLTRGGHLRPWSHLLNPVVLHDPEADR